MPAESPIEYRILEAVAERLRAIRVDAGYSSDIGRDVLISEPLDPQESPPCARVYTDGVASIANDSVATKTVRELRVGVDGVDVAKADPLRFGILMADDIERAVMGPEQVAQYGDPDKLLGGLASRIRVDSVSYSSGQVPGSARGYASVAFSISYIKQIGGK